ncbi:MFS transporter [Nocardiopsis coralli]|uniref:MFS transporter n=1 Tax=Nocardiopsis coralli TaxID=2772213 RepID=UPI002E29C367|nr:MFS transporter [Nocardiopsis coralli]
MSAPKPPGPAAPPGPAYVVLLASSALGTLTSTIISAPINVIADALDAGPSGIVFAVSAFTLAMVLFSPVAGWACERLGPHRVLVGSLGLMVLAQLGAACSNQLWFLGSSSRSAPSRSPWCCSPRSPGGPANASARTGCSSAPWA